MSWNSLPKAWKTIHVVTETKFAFFVPTITSKFVVNYFSFFFLYFENDFRFFLLPK